MAASVCIHTSIYSSERQLMRPGVRPIGSRGGRRRGIGAPRPRDAGIPGVATRLHGVSSRGKLYSSSASCIHRTFRVVPRRHRAARHPESYAAWRSGMATKTYDRSSGKEPVVELRSIDYVPISERHGRPWHLGPVWFQGNAQLATLAVGLLGVSLGLN